MGRHGNKTYEKHDVMTKLPVLLLTLLLLLPWCFGCLFDERKGECVRLGPVPYKEQNPNFGPRSVTPRLTRHAPLEPVGRDDGEVDVPACCS
jgi:hypothetical protein